MFFGTFAPRVDLVRPLEMHRIIQCVVRGHNLIARAGQVPKTRAVPLEIAFWSTRGARQCQYVARNKQNFQFFAEFFTSLFRENVFHASSQKAGILSCAEDSCHTLENYLIDYT